MDVFSKHLWYLISVACFTAYTFILLFDMFGVLQTFQLQKKSHVWKASKQNISHLSLNRRVLLYYYNYS